MKARATSSVGMTWTPESRFAADRRRARRGLVSGYRNAVGAPDGRSARSGMAHYGLTASGSVSRRWFGFEVGECPRCNQDDDDDQPHREHTQSGSDRWKVL